MQGDCKKKVFGRNTRVKMHHNMEGKLASNPR